jgi:hypothetical protein
MAVQAMAQSGRPAGPSGRVADLFQEDPMARRKMAPLAPDPFQFWMAGARLTRLGFEAQAVMAMRMLGMAGLWSVAPSENHRMLAEKQSAFGKAAVGAASAALRGARPDLILGAAITPLHTATAANLARLWKRGPSGGS